MKTDLNNIYEQVSDPIQPFVGQAYVAPHPDDLRLMAIGVSAFVSDDTWQAKQPDWFAGWYRAALTDELEQHLFPVGVAAQLHLLGSLLTTTPTSPFAGRRYSADASKRHHYVTNIVKSYLPASQLARSDQMIDGLLPEHAALLESELDVLAQHKVLPHVVVVFGPTPWAPISTTFADRQQSSGGAFAVEEIHAPTEGEAIASRAARIHTRVGDQPHLILLFRLAHPCLQGDEDVTWLVSKGEFWSFLSQNAG